MSEYFTASHLHNVQCSSSGHTTRHSESENQRNVIMRACVFKRSSSNVVSPPYTAIKTVMFAYFVICETCTHDFRQLRFKTSAVKRGYIRLSQSLLKENGKKEANFSHFLLILCSSYINKINFALETSQAKIAFNVLYIVYKGFSSGTLNWNLFKGRAPKKRLPTNCNSSMVCFGFRQRNGIRSFGFRAASASNKRLTTKCRYSVVYFDFDFENRAPKSVYRQSVCYDFAHREVPSQQLTAAVTANISTTYL